MSDHAPTLTLSADLLLWPSKDMTKVIQDWVDSDEVKTYLNEQARRYLNNPLFSKTAEPTRDRWRAFASLPLVTRG